MCQDRERKLFVKLFKVKSEEGHLLVLSEQAVKREERGCKTGASNVILDNTRIVPFTWNIIYEL